ASLRKVATSQQVGRKDFLAGPRLLRHGPRDNGYTELPVAGAHAVVRDLLPLLHKGPFDRILIAQTLAEGVILLTADPPGLIVGRVAAPLRHRHEAPGRQRPQLSTAAKQPPPAPASPRPPHLRPARHKRRPEPRPIRACRRAARPLSR
ncbi:MAG: type II toxin-antitoxin system VapC family toxin, partial [Acetobacteraceae bacterium]